MKKLLLILALALAPSLAWGQCSGVFQNQTVCGNTTGQPNTPRSVPLASIVTSSVAVKTPVDVATTANITLSGEQIIDGVLTSSSRVLVKDQSTPSQNGIWISAAGAWTRATDWNATGQVVQGTSVYVNNGTTNKSLDFAVTTINPITVGTSNITFTQTPGFIQNGAGAITRTMQSKARDIINAADYGVVCDGVTDDGPNLQKAVTAVLATTYGGELQVPAGLCIIGTQVTFPNTAAKFLVLKGMGAATTFQNTAGLAGIPMFYIGGVSASTGWFRFESFRMKGASTATARGIKLDHANGAAFSDVSFWTMNIAVEMADSYAVAFLNKTFWRDIYTNAIYSTTSAHNLTLNTVSMLTTGVGSGPAIKIDGNTNQINIVNSDFEGGYQLLSLPNGGSSLSFNGNYAEYFTDQLFSFGAMVYSVDISNNWIALGTSWAMSNMTRGQFVRNSVYNQAITFSATTFKEIVVAQNIPLGTGTVPAASTPRYIGSGTETTKFLPSRSQGIQNITPGASIVANQQIGSYGFYNPSEVAVAGISAHYTNNADGGSSYLSFRTGAVDDQAILDTSGNFNIKGLYKINGTQISCSSLLSAAASCATDATNASNISSGTLPSGRLSGSYTGITGVGTLTAGTWQASVIGSAYGGAGSVNGLMKANGSGTVSAASAGTDYLAPNGNGSALTNTTRQMVTSGVSGNIAAATTHYFAIGNASSAFEVLVNGVAPVAGTFQNFYVRMGTAPGVGQSFVLTLRVNAADTGITCTITDANTTCSDTTHTATITAGQPWSIKIVTSAGATPSNPTYGVEFIN